MDPQQVGTGKPNTGFEYPAGTGAGVVCSLASLAASDMPDDSPSCPTEMTLAEGAPRVLKSRNSVTRNEASGSLLSGPCAKLAGQSEGTTAWMAVREACSPANMVAAAGPWPILRKKWVGVPEGRVVVSLKVLEKPLWPWGAMVVVALGKRERERVMAGSRCIVGLVSNLWE